MGVKLFDRGRLETEIHATFQFLSFHETVPYSSCSSSSSTALLRRRCLRGKGDFFLPPFWSGGAVHVNRTLRQEQVLTKARILCFI